MLHAVCDGSLQQEAETAMFDIIAASKLNTTVIENVHILSLYYILSLASVDYTFDYGAYFCECASYQISMIIKFYRACFADVHIIIFLHSFRSYLSCEIMKSHLAI